MRLSFLDARVQGRSPTRKVSHIDTVPPYTCYFPCILESKNKGLSTLEYPLLYNILIGVDWIDGIGYGHGIRIV